VFISRNQCCPAPSTRNSTVAQAAARGVAQPWRRRLLHQLLVTALDRAVPLAEGDESAVSIAEELHLHVAGINDQPFDVQAPIAEGRLRLAAGGGQRGAQVRCLVHPPDATPSPTGYGLDQQREAERIELRGRIWPDRHHQSRHDGHTGGGGRVSGGQLVAEGLHRVRRRTNEHQAGCLDSPCE
jgi:hypothetical protein